MREIRIAADALSFDQRRRLAEAVAVVVLGDPMLLSWYDGERGIESPNGVSECGTAAPTQGVRNYALNRGGALAVCFDGAGDVYCFRDNAGD